MSPIAGLNTTLEALSRGVPMVAVPITNEQPGIAARSRHAGVGDWLTLRGLSPRRLQAAMIRVHADPAYRQRALACAEQNRTADGLERAASIIEEALLGRRRVTRAREIHERIRSDSKALGPPH